MSEQEVRVPRVSIGASLFRQGWRGNQVLLVSSATVMLSREQVYCWSFWGELGDIQWLSVGQA